MQSECEPQARNNDLLDSSFEQANEITACVVYINTVGTKIIIYAVKVVKSKNNVDRLGTLQPSNGTEPKKLKIVV